MSSTDTPLKPTRRLCVRASGHQWAVPSIALRLTVQTVDVPHDCSRYAPDTHSVATMS
jgi:hypothetical protein